MSLAELIAYCPRCGVQVVQEERFGKLRPVCPRCGWVYYADPKVAAGVLVLRGRSVLLVRRAIDPQRGLWTAPAGFIDAGEDPAQAARRECLEETGLEVEISGLVDVIYGQEHPRGANFVIFYHAHEMGGNLSASDDVDQVGFFPLDDLPPLAFSTTIRLMESARRMI